MSTEAKISPAFEPFLAESGPNDKRDAIVIYKAPAENEPRLRGRLRALKQRGLDHRLGHMRQPIRSGGQCPPYKSR